MNKQGVSIETLFLFSQGDVKAFEEIYSIYAPIVYQRLIKLLKDADQAEEVLQTLFIKIWDLRSTIDTTKSIENYLLKIANNLAVDVFRKIVRDRKAVEVIWQDYFSNESRYEEDLQMTEELFLLIEEAVEQMPPQRKMIFRMCKLEGKSYKQVSDLLNISVSTISNQLTEAMKSVKKYVVKHDRQLKMIMFLLLFVKK